MEFNVCRIKKTDEDGKQFVYTDYFSFLNSQVVPGDTVIVPLNVKDDNISIWETGGRKKDASFSRATVVSGPDDRLLNATLFNKINRSPNIKQAMVIIKPDYHVYVGKMNVKHNILAPKIRIIRLVFKGIHDIEDKEISALTKTGLFLVDQVYDDYNSFSGNIAAERLLCKLYSHDVVRPFYANGWNVSKRPNISDVTFSNTVNKISNVENNLEFNDPNKYIDQVENYIAKMNNKKLSSALQIIDFESNKMKMIPLIGLDMKDVAGTLENTSANQSFSIDIEKMFECYNKNIIFEANEIGMLEATLYYDSQYAVNIGNRKYAFIRAWRG